MEKLIIVDVAAITRDGLEGNRDGRKLRSPLGDGIVHGLEQQPCGVQVVARVSLVKLLLAPTLRYLYPNVLAFLAKGTFYHLV